ncbi:undecaprenyl-diphosphate phosphatase [Oscillatoria salina]|uniref:undecaprenyl-diphosphate phosphatase n=1 Tax=Oscillatoria salina TaxID=331517 RepID=UPI0013B8D658|nr:undecaprenyl-diphosphate phosphatase [Oscillatoria salina]MBZ8179668.1 undecaprenyl-diphosphate phosphatase [Oscillatoria salina IIICB1]NET90211.1 undecaprenyl-diphosphate phosphatase [Kamptonema sp. SIO1D9]
MRGLAKKGLRLAVAIAIGMTLAFTWSGLIQASSVVAQVPPTEINTPASTSQYNLFQAAFLGFVQGMTEFLPISSTAHLKAVPVFLGWGDPGVAYTAVIQLGSIAAVVWYFWSDLVQVTVGAIQAIRKSDYQALEFKIALGIGIGTIPIVFFGLLIKFSIPDFDNSPLRSMSAIAIASIVMALLLGLAEKIGTRQRDFEHLSTKDGILMGLAQALALIPGVSRSGSTITAGLFIGLERATAARFSFLLGIPAITIAGLVELKGVFEQNVSSSSIMPLAVGTISSALFSYLAIAWLIRYLQRQSTWVFVWYRLIFGIGILAAIATGLLD